MIIIPAIDIIDGKCVRLSGGDYNSVKVYFEDPLEIAKIFEDNGLNRVHLVDLEGARSRAVKNWSVLERIRNNTSLSVDFSGGIHKQEDVARAFDYGANWVALGSVAVKNEMLVKEWLMEFGAEKFIIGADVKNGRIAIHGWTETANLGWKDLLHKYTVLGVKQFFCTDISKDGLLAGPSVELYRQILSAFPDIFLIASGGVAGIEDIHQLKEAGLQAAIVGKAIYEKHISFEQLKEFNRSC